MTVISGVAPIRIGAPIVPVPIFTYRLCEQESVYKPPHVGYFHFAGDHPTSSICMACVCPDNVRHILCLSLPAISLTQCIGLWLKSILTLSSAMFPVYETSRFPYVENGGSPIFSTPITAIESTPCLIQLV